MIVYFVAFKVKTEKVVHVNMKTGDSQFPNGYPAKQPRKGTPDTGGSTVAKN